MCIHLNLMIFTKIIRGFIRAQFSSGNQTRIKQGLIAKAPLEGWHYGPKEIVKKFHMYHCVAIEYSGEIYDIDNLRRAHLICMMKFITGDS
ncbi:hypothetical protein G871_00119 [Escherichia coli HVH 220 (4-5876842)]|uniref:hypothetical protein n=4 Tax=Enterobacteriaceae TaxID=543 RepID=UPI00038FBFCA|nr:hypothetical protein G790_00146 [Escherichia coli HVH 132 (4-6876862)]EQS29625.1 hypothetical protein G802_00117 [Escherichia coli HVH 144 (4-4451937)]EQV04946.1 hypothetical protein G870_00098 [Escherichia coli HVH 218 (4-4500903)]EQV13483.1 hypothetical protein G871_00119 [Escherichia coli HVH 220 (4-5876842)]ERA81675.1 hypothetical protein G815_00116 [Escherichia coli HVH 157 (4-3406229)]ERA84313.1 hypothetical protein G817_00117 [Escherichia coli HVH 159 (4-5818141)]